MIKMPPTIRLISLKKKLKEILIAMNIQKLSPKIYLAGANNNPFVWIKWKNSFNFINNHNWKILYLNRVSINNRQELIFLQYYKL